MSEFNGTEIKEAFKYTYGRYYDLILTSIATATILLVSLAWNDVIHSAIDHLYPKRDREKISTKLNYALVVTIFVLLLQMFIFPYFGYNSVRR